MENNIVVPIIKGKTKVCGFEEAQKRKIDSFGVFGKWVMANSVLCPKHHNWIHGRCSKLK